MLKLEPKKFALRTRYKRSPGMGDTLEPAEKNAKMACKNTFPRLSEDALVMRLQGMAKSFAPLCPSVYSTRHRVPLSDRAGARL
jgi:hypothetical protein